VKSTKEGRVVFYAVKYVESSAKLRALADAVEGYARQRRSTGHVRQSRRPWIDNACDCERAFVEPLGLCHGAIPRFGYCRPVMVGDAAGLTEHLKD
jgi:hypothetical protein